METYWVFHLASSWRGLSSPSPALNPPLAAGPVLSVTTFPHPETAPTALHGSQHTMDLIQQPSLRAAAVQMVFAARSSREFITPEHVSKLEAWCGQATLEALCAMDIPHDVCVTELEPTAHVTNIFDIRSDCTLRKGAFGTRRVFP